MRWETAFWVGRRGIEGWNIKGMEMNVRKGLVMSKCGLADVSDGGNIMNWYVVWWDKVWEVHKLIQMALCRERYQNHHHLVFLSKIFSIGRHDQELRETVIQLWQRIQQEKIGWLGYITCEVFRGTLLTGTNFFMYLWTWAGSNFCHLSHFLNSV